MPTYHVDLVTDRGLQRVPFTLDDDRPLGGQLNHVLEELRQRGVVLRGGPEDELGVRWNGRDLDVGRSPQALGLTPLHSIELKMRRRLSRAEARTEPPPTPFLARGTYLGAVAGLTGAGLGWVASQGFTDLGSLIDNYGVLDLVVLALLGALVGGMLLGLGALRKGQNVPLETAAGILLGAIGAATGGFLGFLLSGVAGLESSRQGFLLARLLVWAFAAGLLGLALALRTVTLDRIRLLEGLLLGLGGGAIAAMIFSLPGPTQVWQLFGFLLIGLAVGYGVSRNRRALGIFELALVRDRSVGLIGHREWEIYDDRSTPIGRRLKVDAAAGRCKVSPVSQSSEPVILAGTPVQGAVDLLNEDTLTIGDRKYRFRRMPDASV
jgi:hypothetical protein